MKKGNGSCEQFDTTRQENLNTLISEREKFLEGLLEKRVTSKTPGENDSYAPNTTSKMK